jgi:hypothetical protein
MVTTQVCQSRSNPLIQSPYLVHCLQVQDIAQDLAQEYAVAAGDGSSGSSASNLQQQQSLVFELNRSGRYLAMKGQLKQMLVEVVRERYKAAGSTSTPAQVRTAK